MLAAVVDRPDGTVQVRDVPEPPLPGPYDCRCAMVCGTVCAGTDRHILHDRLPWRMQYPLVLGHESVGRVVSVGPKARHLKVGDLVARVGAAPDPAGALHLGWGGFVEAGFARDWRAMREDGLPEAEWRPYRIHQVIPQDLPEHTGPLFITLRETQSYAARLGVGAGARVLIVGSGGNALAFAAHARRAGAESVAVLGAPARGGVFRAAGATAYHDYRDVAAALTALKAAHPDGFTHAIDTVGRPDAADAVLPLLSRGGTLGIYGLDDWDRIALRPSQARGSFTFYNDGYDEAETHDAVIAGLRDRAYLPEWWLGAGIPSWGLPDLPAAFAAVESREAIKPLIWLNGKDS